MSRQKMKPAELRAEMARRKISRRDVSEALGISYSYVLKILHGDRQAAEQRARIAEWLKKNHKNYDMRGIA